ncbi:MAG: response regulator [Actinomycetota bacterium]|nr:response regulator [Actinomycetota bacterium]
MARIMVVDDDEGILMLVQAQLRRNGHQVIAAVSAQEALNSVTEKGAPDVVVLDVGLPDMDGLNLLQSLRDRLELPDLAGIFLTGHIEEENVEAGRALGATYLTKPFVASALLAAIERCVPKDETW